MCVLRPRATRTPGTIRALSRARAATIRAAMRMTGLRVVEVNVSVDDVYLPTDDDAQATASRVS